MYLNNIDFPNKILDALQNKSLVVFAGAGVSVDKPTALPNFEKLAGIVAEDTGKTIKGQSCEVFLGALKAHGIDVNGIAADKLSGLCLQHNQLHKAIIDLFYSYEDVKIVTTNYDQMFEQVITEANVEVPIYNSPALPLGNDVSGIIHIHGNVNNPKYMVLTDEDFGKAYLTEGYVSRFLVKLFETYTILFIGYSYNDVIMRYLTRAMSRERTSDRYILTDDTKSDWSSLGIIPIKFPKRAFAQMRNAIIKPGVYSKQSLLDLNNQLSLISVNPPQDITIDSQIDYCLSCEKRSKIMVNCIRGDRWLELLNKKNVFSSLFSDSVSLDERDLLWVDWLASGFVGEDDSCLFRLISQHGNRMHKKFADEILKRVIKKRNSLSSDNLVIYLNILDEYINAPWIILQLIEIASIRGLYHLVLNLFEKLFYTSMELKEERSGGKVELKLSHVMQGEYYVCREAWNYVKNNALNQYPEELLMIAQNTIEKVRYRYVDINRKNRGTEFWKMSDICVEDYEEEEDGLYLESPFNILIEAFLSAVKRLPNKEARFYLKRGIGSESTLLCRVALRGIRETEFFDDDEKLMLICDNDLVWNMWAKQQVFLLAKDVFLKAALVSRNKLIDVIEDGAKTIKDEVTKQYEIYNWCVWLNQLELKNDRIESIIQSILRRYQFKPREHPELDYYLINPNGFEPEKSPVSSGKMLELPDDKLLDLLINYNNSSFSGPTRGGLLSEFSKCVKENPKWALRVLDCLHKDGYRGEELWRYMFYGLREAEISVDESLKWCHKLSGRIDKTPVIFDISMFLLRTFEKGDIKDKFKGHELLLYELSLDLWERREQTKPSIVKTVERAANSTTGILLQCWLYMAFYADEDSISTRYKERFTEAIQLKSWEHQVAVCILAGNFNFLCIRDREWYFENFEKMLTGEKKTMYSYAWEGFVYFSGRISKESADVVAPIFLKAVRYIDRLRKDVKRHFVELYLTLMIYAVSNPTSKYIPEYYDSASEDDICLLINAMVNRLNNMEEDDVLSWWNNWLNRFLANRKNNKPKELFESECKCLFMMLPHLECAFEKAVEIACKGMIPSTIEHLFWRKIESKALAITHYQATAKLIIALLGKSKALGDSQDCVIRIVSSLHMLEEKEKKQMQEVLLKHSIKLPPILL